MSFADAYLEQKVVSPITITVPPSDDLAQIIVIPCYDEPDLLVCLESLIRCQQPPHSVEVIIIINAARSIPQEVIKTNELTYIQTAQWSERNKLSWLRFHVFNITDLPDKYAGPGLARKIGMDLAVHRFNKLNRPEGIITSLDADTTVSPDYFREIQQLFTEYPSCTGCTLYFEHPIEGKEYPENIYQAIIQYELHLRYYIEAVRYTGFPFAFHTVGSIFSVRAGTYVRQGGMNRRQAGEDFYFLQKVIPLGDFRELNSTCVYPSPRPSERVPFGTGPFIRKFIEQGSSDWLTFKFDAFRDLKDFFDKTDLFFHADETETEKILDSLPDSIREFVSGEIIERLNEINANSARIESFRKRFLSWFNMFRILKYLNFAHESYYQKVPVAEAAQILLDEKDITDSFPTNQSDSKQLLLLFRKIQRSGK